MWGVLAVVAATLSVTGAAVAAPDPNPEPETLHDQILAYWTPERLAAARPVAAAADGDPDDAGAAGATGDDRVVKGAWEDADAAVAATTGKIFLLLDGTPYVCSGAAIDHASGADVVLTAGHCLWEADTVAPIDPAGHFAEYVLFVPGYHGGFVPGDPASTVDYDLYTAEAVFTTAGWQSGAYGDDVGLAVVTAGDAGPDFETHFEGDDLPSVAFADSGEVAPGDTVSAFGYPSGRNYAGAQLGYCQGPLEHAGPDVYALRCQLGGGASGGPWYAGAAGRGPIISVNSYLLRGDNRVHAPVFDGPESQLFAQAADGRCDRDETCAPQPGKPGKPDKGGKGGPRHG
jgi:hypothetical protein